jgi:ribosomal protein S20
MPNLKNAKKALRQAKKRAEQNLLIRNAYKKAIKVVEKGLAAGQAMQEEVKSAQQKIAKAAKTGVLQKNTAARKIAGIMKKAGAATKK